MQEGLGWVATTLARPLACHRGPETKHRRKAGVLGSQPLVRGGAMAGLGVESLDGALDGDQHGVAVAILGLGGGDLHPTFADAVLLDIGALLAVHANADLVLEALGHMVRAARVGRQAVGQGRFVVAHFIYLSLIKSGSL